MMGPFPLACAFARTSGLESTTMIRIGTASWTDPTLLASGLFYPAMASTPETRLRYYASQFPLVEVNASYYAIPDAMQAHNWALRTPDAFKFHIKAFRLFTGHPTPVAALDKDLRDALADPAQSSIFYNQVPGEIRRELWGRFLQAIEPLRMADKLATVHFQFPPWVRPDARGLSLLDEASRQMEGHTIAFEFRHQSWLTGPQCQATLALERDLGVVHTIVDAPQGFENTVPAVWESTHPDLALVRLHGRNTATWNHKGAASSGRFMYDYTAAELADIAEHIRRLSAKIARTHVVFNTNYQDQGMRNAKGLQQAL